MARITKKVSVWYDDGNIIGMAGESGWVARCTEYDDGEPVMGRIGMDDLVGDGEDIGADEARELAARFWGVDVDDVTVED